MPGARKNPGASRASRVEDGADARTPITPDVERKILRGTRDRGDMARMARKYGLPYPEILKLVHEADTTGFKRILEMPEAERGRHYRLIDEVIGMALRAAADSRIVRDRNGKTVTDVLTGKPLTRPANAKYFSVVLDALTDQRDIAGLDAPIQLENITSDRSIVSRDDTKALLADPVGRELIFKLEERNRELRKEANNG